MKKILKEKTKKLILEVLPKKNFHIGKTCKAVGIARKTYYQWLKEDEEFKTKVEELFEYDIDDSEEKLRLLRQGLPKFDDDGRFIGWIEKPDFRAIQFHLTSKGKDRGYVERIENINRNIVEIEEDKIKEKIKQLEEEERKLNGK